MCFSIKTVFKYKKLQKISIYAKNLTLKYILKKGINMKKILLSLAFVLAYIIPANADVTRALGVTVSDASIDSKVTDDIDNNGSIDTTKNLTNDTIIGSIFAEITNDGVGPGSLTLGVDLIPMSAELESRTTTQSSVKSKAAGAASTGTNKGSVDVFMHTTVYIQPGITGPNGFTFFGTLGYVHATAQAKGSSASSTDVDKDLDLNGIKLGLGVKKDFGDDMFFKVEYAETDYDDISVTTDNNTKITADIDNTTLGLSIGKKF